MAISRWPLAVPPLAVSVLAVALWWSPGALLLTVSAIALVGAVLAAVHHAEVVAHRVGEPFGTLVLALAVTAIETSLIVSMMLAGGDGSAALARDAMFAAVMIIANGLVGASILIGALRHREQSFRIESAGPGLAALVTLVTLVLVMPALTVSAAGPRYTRAQLAFVALSSLVLWSVFTFFQTVRHRDYFLPPDGTSDETIHAPPPTARQAWASFALLLVSLVGVIGLAKVLSPTIESVVRRAGAPPAVLGVTIALVVLLPESIAAIRAALADRLQTSVNLAIGSGLATIGLTVPVVVLVCMLLDIPLVLGLEPKDMALLALTLLVCTIVVGSGRTTVMQGAVQLVIFAAFLFLAVVP